MFNFAQTLTENTLASVITNMPHNIRREMVYQLGSYSRDRMESYTEEL